MRKSIIFHIKNNIKIENVHCISQIRLNNDELTPWAEKTKTLHIVKKMGRYNFFCQLKILAICLHTETVRKLMFEKQFRVLLVTKS